jgi:DNA polymerase III subunit gamma/tau
MASTRAMLGAVDQQHLYAILDALARGDGAAMLAKADDMAARSLSFEGALLDLGSLLHRLALAQQVPTTVADDDPDREILLAQSSRFAADELQLYYQIVVQGRSEIGLAPDEYAGFTMTLLRMLAFAPGAQVQASTTPRQIAGVLPAASSPRAPVTASADQAAVPAGADGAPAPVAVDPGTSWETLVQQLGLVGIAKQLAQHCEMAQLDASQIALSLPKAQEHLLGAQQGKLRDALQKRFGAAFKVAITIAQGEINSPAAIANREQQERQTQAEQEIQRDPFVKELQASFGARVKASSIKPLS